MDRLDVLNAMIDLYESSTQQITEANMRFQAIEDHVEEQRAIYNSED